MAIAWEEARDWLVECGVITLEKAASLLELASVLQNGVVLCNLLNKAHNGIIANMHANPKLQVGCFGVLLLLLLIGLFLVVLSGCSFSFSLL
jgi:hypothetical protein